MFKSKYFLIVVIIVVTLMLAWLINMGFLFGDTSNSSQKQVSPALYSAINACISISEKSVAHMQAKVPFQQLEIIGRKARVMRLCMQDHDYQQSPAWTTFANVKAKEKAQQDNISEAEAFELLRRQYMVMTRYESDIPLFWIPSKK